jgi:hypothetical protein
VALEVEFYVAGGWEEDECFEVVGERVAKRPGKGRAVGIVGQGG